MHHKTTWILMCCVSVLVVFKEFAINPILIVHL